MAEEVKKAPGEEAKDTKQEVTPETKVVKETTVGDIINPPKEEKEVKMVPEAVFLEEKRERKELAKKVKDLENRLADGASNEDVSDDVKSLAEDLGVTEAQVSKLIKAVGSKTRKEIEAELEAKIKPIEEKSSAEKFEKVFSEHFSKAIESMPEYDKLVNKDVIKSLALDPKNSGKTLTKIIEDAYGHLVTGKRTMEQTRAGGDGKEVTDIDFNRAKSDPEYFKEIMSNPESKKAYNAGLIGRLKL